MKLDTINHPILIIGLGGTGTDALLRVKLQVHKRFAKQGKIPENIGFLAFETNEHDKKKYHGMGLESHEWVLLSNAGIGAILNNRSSLPDYINAWLSPELTISDGTKGASGNRQAGRLLLFEKINSTIDAIDNKIRTLRVAQENKLLVFILTGLSGGTGGGMFLDIAYIIRGLMERDHGAKGIDKADISGYLFTPDVHIAGNTLNIYTEEYIQRNGYAALKELDYWMNVEERTGDRFTQRYGTRLTVNSTLPPFNFCHLISATNIDGVYLKDAYGHCLDVTAENIVNFMAQEDKTGFREFAIHDYYSNLLANIATMKSGLPAGADHSANYIYNIIGASAAVLPATEVNARLAHRLFDIMNEMFDVMPDYPKLKEFVGKAGIDTETLSADLARRLPPLYPDNIGTNFYNYQNVIKTRRADVDNDLNELYMKIKSSMGDGKRESVTVIESVKAALREVFLHPKRGPVYATRLIESDINPCLLPWIETCIKHLLEKQKQVAEEIETHALSAANIFDAASKALFFTRESKKNAFVSAKLCEYQTRLQRDCYGYVIDVYKAVHAALEEENNKVYIRYAEALLETRKTLAKNKEEHGDKFGWKIVDTDSAANEADERVKSIGKDTLVKSFLKSLLENGADITAILSDFIDKQFGAVTSRSMEDYLSEEAVEADIAPRLHRDALPVFHMDNAGGIYHFPSYGLVSVPNDAPSVLRGIERYRENALSGLKFNIRRSNLTDRIFWLNTINGVPLFAYTPLRVYEALYERTIDGKEGIGRHFWHNLPSPLPESLWGDTYFNARVKAANDRAREIFYDALKLGTIVQRAEQTNSRYVAVLREDFDAEPYAFDESTDAPTLHELSLRLRALLADGGPPITEKRPLYNSPTEALALAHFLRNPKLIEAVEAENAKCKTIADTLSLLTECQNTHDREKTATDDFLTALVCEAIVRQGEEYLYNHAINEEKWPPLVNLMEQADHPEFSLYATYKSLPFDKKERIRQRAKYIRESFPDGRLLSNLRNWQKTLGTRREALENGQNPSDEAAYPFYRGILQRVTTHIAALV
jgi:hypothetical protein